MSLLDSFTISSLTQTKLMSIWNHEAGSAMCLVISPSSFFCYLIFPLAYTFQQKNRLHSHMRGPTLRNRMQNIRGDWGHKWCWIFSYHLGDKKSADIGAQKHSRDQSHFRSKGSCCCTIPENNIIMLLAYEEWWNMHHSVDVNMHCPFFVNNQHLHHFGYYNHVLMNIICWELHPPHSMFYTTLRA